MTPTVVLIAAGARDVHPAKVHLLAAFADRELDGAPAQQMERARVRPTLLAYSGPLFDKQELAWWENRCGYAPDMTSLLREESAAVEPQDFQRVWIARWGGPRVIEPLTGPQGVVLLHELPQKADELRLFVLK